MFLAFNNLLLLSEHQKNNAKQFLEKNLKKSVIFR